MPTRFKVAEMLLDFAEFRIAALPNGFSFLAANSRFVFIMVKIDYLPLMSDSLLTNLVKEFWRLVALIYLHNCLLGYRTLIDIKLL